MHLYHSYPRFASRTPRGELADGWAVFKSVLDHGLLLTHEKISYPFVHKEGIDPSAGSTVDQVRCCFTLLDCDELVDHSTVFGAYSLEFDLNILRSLGAFPVVYIPQPVRNETGFKEVSIIGNNMVQQIRDVAILLQEVIELQRTLYLSPDLYDVEVEIETKRKSGRLKFSAIDLILDHLLGSKGSFENLLYAVEFFSNLFYHVDSARRDILCLEEDMQYYLQREWRIVSGLKADGVEVDRDLTEHEVRRLEEIADFFRNEIALKGGKPSKRSMAARLISTVQGEPFWKRVQAFYVPDVVFDDALREFGTRGLPVERLKSLDYQSIVRRRAKLV